jgi:phosphogluconate dehydratase
VLVDAAEFSARAPASANLEQNEFGMGRELFAIFRQNAGTADNGASVFA